MTSTAAHLVEDEVHTWVVLTREVTEVHHLGVAVVVGHHNLEVGTMGYAVQTALEETRDVVVGYDDGEEGRGALLGGFRHCGGMG